MSDFAKYVKRIVPLTRSSKGAALTERNVERQTLESYVIRGSDDGSEGITDNITSKIIYI